MRYISIAFLTVAAASFPVAAMQPNGQALFSIADVDRETVPAGTPAAFEAAFGHKTDYVNERWYELTREVRDQKITFVPLTLVPLPDGRKALISTGANDCTGDVCSGVNSIHYLRREGALYKVEGEWLEAGASSTLGKPATRWGLMDAITAEPVLYTEGSSVLSGYACSYASLTELTQAGPVEIARIPIHYSNSGATEAGFVPVTLTGEIIAAEKGRSFTVRYAGSRTFSERYVRNADGSYNLAGTSQVPRC